MGIEQRIYLSSALCVIGSSLIFYVASHNASDCRNESVFTAGRAYAVCYSSSSIHVMYADNGKEIIFPGTFQRAGARFVYYGMQEGRTHSAWKYDVSTGEQIFVGSHTDSVFKNR